MPWRTRRDRRRYDIEKVPDLLADLDLYLEEVDGQEHTRPIDRWFAHILYNALWRIQEEQHLRQEILAIVREVVGRIDYHHPNDPTEPKKPKRKR